LGFARGKTPCTATLHYVLAALDWVALEAALRPWAQALWHRLEAQEAAQPPPEESLGQAVAVDGKTRCGALKLGAEWAQLVSVLGHRLGRTHSAALVQTGDEIAAIEPVLTQGVLVGRIVTVDALHTQRETARRIKNRGGE
jgi:hypothetical protein